MNIQQGQSLLSVADGGLAQIGNVLQRMMALAAESASGQVTDSQRSQDIDTEYQALSGAINAIASGTQYAGQSLLNYANAQGAFSWNSSSVLTGFFEAQVLRNTSFGADASQVSGPTGTFSDTGQVAKYTSGSLGLPTGTSGTIDTSAFASNDSFGRTEFLTGTGSVGAIGLSIGAFNTETLGLEQDTITYQDIAPPSTIDGQSIGAYLAANPTVIVAGQVVVTVQATTSNVASQSAAMTAITTLSSALSRVSQERAALGAYESRFTFSGAAVQDDLQHTQASVSVLADADVAGVKASLSAEDVQTQAAIAATTQAALLPSELLKLIQS